VRSHHQHFCGRTLIAGLLLIVTNGLAQGKELHLYDANDGPQPSDPSSFYGWTGHYIGPGTNHTGIPITSEPGYGIDAWGINDNSTSANNPFYSQCIDAPTATGGCSTGAVRAAALQYGWRYSTKARLAADHGTAASMGLSIWLENRGYFAMFDLDGTNLRVTLLNATSQANMTLTTGGVGASAYHDIALVYLPASQRVAFEFDGVIRGYTTGSSQAHENAMLWGNISNSGRGQMNFNKVTFEVLLPGDYNRDSVVNAADYTRWRDSVATNQAAADGNGDGTIDAADYQYWIGRFGTSGPISFGMIATLPEPSGAVLFALAWLSQFMAAASVSRIRQT
jgi:hypothetical protein